MDKIKSIIMVIILSFSSCKTSFYTQGNTDLKVIAMQTKTSLKDLKGNAIKNNDEVILDKLDNIENKRKELFYLLDGCNEKNTLTQEYLNTLKEAQKTIQSVSETYKKTSGKEEILDAIYLDFTAKEASIKSDENNDANIKVKVTIDSTEDEGFFVFGKLSFEQGSNIKRFRFNKPTQKASQDFVPGYYLFWLEKDDLVGKPELHLIILNGEDKVKTLVLKAPKK